MHAAGELEENHRALDRQEQIARRVALMEHLHVARAGGVAHVDGIEQQTGGDVAPGHLVLYAAQAIGAHRGVVDAAVSVCLSDVGQQIAVERWRVAALAVPVQFHLRKTLTELAQASARRAANTGATTTVSEEYAA